jgi:hypothetical protein
MKTLIELIPSPDIPVSFTDKIQDQIISRLKALSLDKVQFKSDVKVLLWVCVCLESLISKENKLDKKKMCLDIYRSIYGISEEEQRVIENNIDILHATKRIKKKHYFRLFLTSIREVFSL